MKFESDWSQVTGWLNNFDDRKRARTIALFAIGDELKSEVKKETRKISVTNQLFNSIISAVLRNEMTIYSAKYGEIALETGRKPGKMPPVDALKRWARFRFGNEDLAFPIAKKIAGRRKKKGGGTQKYINKGPKQLSEVEKKIDKIIQPAVVKLLEAYTE